MTVRHRMTMRAYVQQDDNAGTTDGVGQPVAPSWSAKETIPCKAWSENSRQLLDANRTAVLEGVVVLLPLDADVVDTDRIEKITNRQDDRTFFPGPLRIDTIQQWKGSKELFCEVVS